MIAIALLFAALPALGAGFDVPLPLGELISTADAVVVGKIASVSRSRLTFEVDEVLRGSVASRKIAVEPFRASAESPRWAPYGRGQNVILFLAARPRVPYRILGRIGEGEIPFDRQHAYFHGRYVEVLRPDYYVVDGRKVYLQRFERAKTIDAIRSYPPCVTWKKKITCSAVTIAEYGRKSALHEFLMKEALQSLYGDLR